MCITNVANKWLRFAETEGENKFSQWKLCHLFSHQELQFTLVVTPQQRKQSSAFFSDDRLSRQNRANAHLLLQKNMTFTRCGPFVPS